MERGFRQIILKCWLLSLAGILYCTLIPFNFNWEALQHGLNHLRWVPFWNIKEGHLDSISDMAQNVILYIPTGILGLLITKKIIWTILISAGLSVSVELIQLFLYSRYTSITDIFTNVIGTGIGCAIALTLSNRLPPALSDKLNTLLKTLKPAFPALFFGFICCVGVLLPFRYSFSLGLIKSGLKVFINNFLSLRPLKPTIFTDIICFSIFGFFIAQFARYKWPNSNCLPALYIFSALFLVLFSFQALLAPYPPTLASVVLIAVAGVAGIGAARSNLSPKTGRRSIILIILIFVSIELFFSLYPFKLKSYGINIHVIPFLHLYYTYPIRALGEFTQQFLSYFPAAFLLGAAFYKMKFNASWYLRLFFLLLLVVEFLQAWIRYQFSDITDWIIQILGIYAGIYIGKYFRGANYKLLT